MKKNTSPSPARRDTSGATILYLTKRPAPPPAHDERAARFEHWTNARYIPLSRLLQPYEYWTHGSRADASDDAHASLPSEPDPPPRKARAAAPPGSLAGRLRSWFARGWLYFRAR